MTHFRLSLILLAFLVGLCACVPSNQNSPTPTGIPATTTLVPTLTITPTATSLACLLQPGRLEQGSINTTKPSQEFLIYLPPCYYEKQGMRYPVLYLLHGQTYTNDQWLRLGAAVVADRLMIGNEVRPFIIVFPDDRYWNVQAGPEFGRRLVDNLIPYIDHRYRTQANREHRAIGGMSRGAGWALQLGLQRWDLFGSLGLHSLAVFGDDRPFLENRLEQIPPESWPHIFLDTGDRDQELGFNTQFEALLTEMGIPHEWHLYPGLHDEQYWGAHIEEYLRWYAQVWEMEDQPVELPTPTPTP